MRRQWRRLRYAVRPPEVRFIYDPAYERYISGVPIDPLRADRILAFPQRTRGLIRREEISPPRPAALKNILLVHAPEYLDALQRPETLTRHPRGAGQRQRARAGPGPPAAHGGRNDPGHAVGADDPVRRGQPRRRLPPRRARRGGPASAFSTTWPSRSRACVSAALPRRPWSWISTSTTATARARSSPPTPPCTRSPCTTSTGGTPRPSRPPASRSAPV